jgi:hypothetical protein
VFATQFINTVNSSAGVWRVFADDLWTALVTDLLHSFSTQQIRGSVLLQNPTQKTHEKNLRICTRKISSEIGSGFSVPLQQLSIVLQMLSWNRPFNKITVS